MKVLVTGASGFVGRALVPALAERGHAVQGTSRVDGPALGDVAADWRPWLDGCDAVVHLAAMVHVMKRTSVPADRFHVVNVEGTMRLAEQAAGLGVKRFVFLSSIKVHGDVGHVTEGSPRTAADPYGSSKRHAEDGVLQIASRTGMEVVSVRPPLIYGPGVRANFASLASAVRRGIPLPFGSVRNARSLVGLANLCDFLGVALVHPDAAGEAFLVTDGDDLSTPELIARMNAAIGRRSRVWPVPIGMLQTGAALAGRAEAMSRLLGSLTADISKAARLLGWRPPYGVNEQLRAAMAGAR